MVILPLLVILTVVVPALSEMRRLWSPVIKAAAVRRGVVEKDKGVAVLGYEASAFDRARGTVDQVAAEHGLVNAVVERAEDVGRRQSPCSKATRTSSLTSGRNEAPRLLPAPIWTIRAQSEV